jgi:hypothetical protein
MPAIPYDAGDINADWLRASVGPENVTDFANLRSLSARPLGEGFGMSTDISRLTLDYVAGAKPGPATLIAKLPSSRAEVRAAAKLWTQYAREVMFYRDIAPTLSLRTPRPYVAEHDPATDRFILVLEDLTGAVASDQVAGLSLDQATLALDQIAGLHAAWWNRPALKALEASVHPLGDGPWIGTGERHRAAWPRFAPFLTGRASHQLLRVGERMADRLEDLMTDMAKPPRTLCHGDFRADNLMFTTSSDGLALATVDWQAVLQARGPVDVGGLMSMSVTTELRRAHETVLLRRYHDSLLAAGIQDYPFDQCFHDYRRALLFGFTYVVQSGAVVDLEHARTRALFESAVRRVDAAVADLGLSAFVD